MSAGEWGLVIFGAIGWFALGFTVGIHVASR